MTWANLFFLYAAIGLAVSVLTLRTFPPMEGFIPKLSIRVFAGLVFAALWPFLVVLGIWYFSVGHFNRFRQERTVHETHGGIDLTAMQQQMISKPR